MRTDPEIERDVKEELEWDQAVNSKNLTVKVNNGVVILSGTLNSYPKKIAAGKATARVRGVTDVINEVEIRFSGELERSDDEIEEVVFNALKWNSAIPGQKISAVVKNGWVTLTGDVALQHEKEMAEKLAGSLAGVKGIHNLIYIVSKAVSLNDVRDKITAALNRNVNVNGDKINIIVSGQKVTLTGNVRTFLEKQRAEAAAWSAPGVNMVENKLEVSPAEIYA